MSSDRRNNEQRKDDPLNHSQNLILSTESTSHQLQHERQQQQQHDKIKKKKCRGNRKLQHFRAKLRKQGFDAETITTLINDYNNYPSQQNNEEEFTVLNNIDVEVLIPLRDQV
jgi:hypothetical protein